MKYVGKLFEQSWYVHKVRPVSIGFPNYWVTFYGKKVNDNSTFKRNISGQIKNRSWWILREMR